VNAFPTKILLATDGSSDAALAASAAVDVVSRGTGTELHLVHVLPQYPRYAYPGITTEVYSYVLDKTNEEARRLLDEQARRVEDRGGTVAETHTRRGRFVDVILDLAEEIGARLILMGSRGLGPVKRLLLGSVAAGVVQNARCPVLVLRGGEGSWPPERIVFGDDGSETSKAAGDLAAALFGRHGTRSLVVRVFPQLPEVDVEGRESDARMVDDELRHEENALMERSKELGGRLGPRPPTARLAVGNASGCLLEAAEEDAPERTLLAVGSRGLGAVGRMGLGSVSTNVLHAARGPVLVYPPLHDEA